MKLNLMMSFSVEVILWKTKVSTKMFVVRAYFISCSKILNRNDILRPYNNKDNLQTKMLKLDFKQNFKKWILSFFKLLKSENHLYKGISIDIPDKEHLKNDFSFIKNVYKRISSIEKSK